MRRAVGLFGVLLGSFALAADAPPAASQPAVPQPAAAMGERFSGPFDVSFKPFADAKTAERLVPGELMRFVRDDKQWLLTFSRFELPDPIPLADTPGPDGQVTAGYLTLAVNKLRSGDGNVDVLRNEIIDLGDLRMGVFNATMEERKKPILSQQLLIEITPRLYYSINFTSPLDNADPSKSVTGREAAMVFKAVLDSVERVDLSQMKRDQDDRLLNTRGLFAEWNRRRILGTLKAQQFIRVKREGKDVGYVYAVEQAADSLPRTGEAPAAQPDVGRATGFRVGRRTHVLAEDGRVIDTESWAHVTFDRAHEVWSVVTVPKDPAAKVPPKIAPWTSEVGSSDRQVERTRPEGQKEFRDVERRYKLSVTSMDAKLQRPVLERDLPPFYLPQALGLILPRIIPSNRSDGYLFATYQSDERQIMLRYVDVTPESDVTFDGRRVRAIVVSERIGYTGTQTLHLLSPRGDYLGTKAADGKVELIPTDKATLQGLWKDADFREPETPK